MNAAEHPGQSGGPLVSVVVIGRNEGDRLVRCLESVQRGNWHGRPYEIIYVDSRSTDGSVERAESLGARTLVLDDPSPCAAKARNLGWTQAHGEFILFLDGDTLLDPDFVGRALKALEDPTLCAAWGHRRESNPGQSILTRVLDLDWVYPAGRTLYFGGDVLVRKAALVSVNGFDPTLKAGEEPEMCARLRAAGWQIEHIDAPMTRHDLAITTLRGYWLRAYRSGIAYAEVADRMRQRNDPMWQREAQRDFVHGMLLIALPFVLLLSLLWSPWLAVLVCAAVGVVLFRTVRRCRWKAPDDPLLCWQYAVHAYLQKIPAFFGQLAWRRAQGELALVDYKGGVDTRAGTAGDQPSGASVASGMRPSGLKSMLVRVLVPLAGLWRRYVIDRWLRVWSMARLQEAIGGEVHPSNVILGPVQVQGTGNIHFGRNAMIYPGVYLETQGEGRIEIGDDVVFSGGVHIVAFDRVTIGRGAMIGEYSSLRDANHNPDPVSVRRSGHTSAPIEVGDNVWIGRGACVLKGARLGANCIVAANAVVTGNVEAGTCVAGVPARPIRQRNLPAN